MLGPVHRVGFGVGIRVGFFDWVGFFVVGSARSVNKSERHCEFVGK